MGAALATGACSEQPATLDAQLTLVLLFVLLARVGSPSGSANLRFELGSVGEPRFRDGLPEVQPESVPRLTSISTAGFGLAALWPEVDEES